MDLLFNSAVSDDTSSDNSQVTFKRLGQGERRSSLRPRFNRTSLTPGGVAGINPGEVLTLDEIRDHINGRVNEVEPKSGMPERPHDQPSQGCNLVRKPGNKVRRHTLHPLSNCPETGGAFPRESAGWRSTELPSLAPNIGLSGMVQDQMSHFSPDGAMTPGSYKLRQLELEEALASFEVQDSYSVQAAPGSRSDRSHYYRRGGSMIGEEVISSLATPNPIVNPSSGNFAATASDGSGAKLRLKSGTSDTPGPRHGRRLVEKCSTFTALDASENRSDQGLMQKLLSRRNLCRKASEKKKPVDLAPTPPQNPAKFDARSDADSKMIDVGRRIADLTSQNGQPSNLDVDAAHWQLQSEHVEEHGSPETFHQQACQNASSSTIENGIRNSYPSRTLAQRGRRNRSVSFCVSMESTLESLFSNQEMLGDCHENLSRSTADRACEEEVPQSTSRCQGPDPPTHGLPSAVVKLPPVSQRDESGTPSRTHRQHRNRSLSYSFSSAMVDATGIDSISVS